MGYNPNWSGGDFVIKKVKNTVPSTYVKSDPNTEKIVGIFYKKELLKTSQEKTELRKQSREKAICCTSNGITVVIHSIAGLI